MEQESRQGNRHGDDRRGIDYEYVFLGGRRNVVMLRGDLVTALRVLAAGKQAAESKSKHPSVDAHERTRSQLPVEGS